MCADRPVFVIDDDPRSRAALKAFLGDFDAYASCCVCGSSDLKADADQISFVLSIGDTADFEADIILPKPVRVGAVCDGLDRILKKRAALAKVKDLSIDSWILDVNLNVLSPAQGKKDPVRLTEKEKDILVILQEYAGETVTREILLQEIWGYVDGVETHTLETHIYRLRQKIEEDPAAPVILLTTDAGYKLA